MFFNTNIQIPSMNVSRDYYWKTTYSTLENKYFNMALTRFVYKNIPEQIDPMSLEMALLYNGSVAFIELNGKVYVVPSVMSISGSAYAGYRPTVFQILPSTTDEKEDSTLPDGIAELYNRDFINGKDGIIMGNDSRYYPSYGQITQFLVPMTNLFVQRLNNEKKLSAPIIIETNDQNTDVYEKQLILNAINDDDFAVLASGSKKVGELADTKVIDYSQSYHGKEIGEAIDFYDTQIKSLLSKNNFSRTTDSGVGEKEINMQEDGNHSNGLMAFNMRKEALKLVNEKYGTDMYVEWRDSNELQTNANNAGQDVADELPGD